MDRELPAEKPVASVLKTPSPAERDSGVRAGTARPSGRAGLQRHYLALQRTAGNRAVAQLLGPGLAEADNPGAPTDRAVQREEDPAAETPTAASGAAPGPAGAPPPDTVVTGSLPAKEPEVEESQTKGLGVNKEDDEPAMEVQGTLPNGQTPGEEQLEKGKGALKEDGSGSRRTGTPASKPNGAARRPVRVRVGDVRLAFESSQKSDIGEMNPDDAKAAHEDQVKSGTPSVNWSNPGGKTVSPFGSESFEPSYTDVSWRAANNEIKVDFTLNIKCPWGVNSGGKIDVPSATASVITSANYSKIVSDLTPKLVEKSWRAPRSQYWSQSICERHEKFHSTDDKAWAEGPGKQLVMDFLNTKTIDIGFVGRFTSISPDTTAELTGMLDEAMKRMGTANFAFYTGGAGSYLSYAGEERAFGDGRVPYEELAAGVKQQGEGLKLLDDFTAMFGGFSPF